MKIRSIDLSAYLRLCGLLFLLTAYCLPLTAQTVDYTKWVNPFIGTGGHGHTFPGATMPFGMVQLSPDTRTDNWDGSSGYHYSDDTIYGFSHTHLSGTGIPDYCDILLLPYTGETKKFSKFSHADESAEPGYYSVHLDDAVFVELTSTTHVGIHRYSFPNTGSNRVRIDLGWRDKLLDANVEFVGRKRIEGFRRSSSWAKDQKVYFVAEFSRPFHVIARSSLNRPDQPKASKDELPKLTPTGGELVFDSGERTPVIVKVAISNVSIEGARKNLAAELPGWDFDEVRAAAKAAWNKELSKIEVSGGTDAQTTTFYTALYHTMIQPNIFNDVDGSYRGHDGKVHNIREDIFHRDAETPRSKGQLHKPAREQGRYTQRRTTTPSAEAAATPPKQGGEPSNEYTVFSLWDTFRAAHPLYTIIDQKRTVDFINTFIRQYEQGGRLPVWELAGNETDTMIGYHAVSVIADAMAKGIKGFDYEKAYAAAKHSAELDHFGLAAYKRRGYISMEDENESVSKTLEYAYDDSCIATMALAVMDKDLKELARIVSEKGRSFDKKRDIPAGYDAREKMIHADFDKYLRRSLNYRNLFDAETGFMRPRKNGGFINPFAPNEVTFNYTEGNAWQYTFFVPHDISGLIDLLGGKQNFANKLDDLFSTSDKLTGRAQPDITGLIGQYAHGNEPSHHIAYLYNYAGEPWKTQKLVRQILDEFYKPTPDGLIGNEDCGQMSAWYVLSALGFYQVAPGREFFDIGTPLFKKAKIHLENGKTFVIKSPNVSDKNIYVKSVKLNGGAYRDTLLSQWDLTGDNSSPTPMTLEFEMTDTPDKTWFTHFSVSNMGGKFVAVPIVRASSTVFEDKASIFIESITPNARIFYSTDGSEPSERSMRYTGPISTDHTTTIEALAINPAGERSQIVNAKFIKKPNNWTVSIASKYNRQYTGAGDEGLIDGIRGTTSFASGEWQGYQAQDFVATVDLQKETEISKLGGGFLQNAGSWIWMPTHIEFEVSQDNVTFTKVANIKTDIALTDIESKVRDYTQSIAPVKARYVRVHAYNLGKIPSWHPGAGDEAFIFVDELIIQ